MPNLMPCADDTRRSGEKLLVGEPAISADRVDVDEVAGLAAAVERGELVAHCVRLTEQRPDLRIARSGPKQSE